MPSVSNQEIKKYIESIPEGPNKAKQVYDAAKQYGVSGSQIEQAMGIGAGEVKSYVQQQGWQPLSGTGMAATPAPTQPATTPAQPVGMAATPPKKTVGGGMAQQVSPVATQAAKFTPEQYGLISGELVKSLEAGATAGHVFTQMQSNNITKQDVVESMKKSGNFSEENIRNFESEYDRIAGQKFTPGQYQQISSELVRNLEAGTPPEQIFVQMWSNDITKQDVLDSMRASGAFSDENLQNFSAEYDRLAKTGMDFWSYISPAINSNIPAKDILAKMDQEGWDLELAKATLQIAGATPESIIEFERQYNAARNAKEEGEELDAVFEFDMPEEMLTAEDTGVDKVFKPQLRTPSGESLVESRIQNLLNENGPYIQAAANRAQEMMSGRGMLDSSMAAGAIERARIEAALQIASQDAATYAGLERQQFEADLANYRDYLSYSQDIGRAGVGFEYDVALTGRQAEISRALQQEAGDIASRHIQERAAVDERLLGIENEFRAEIEKRANQYVLEQIKAKGIENVNLAEVQEEISSRLQQEAYQIEASLLEKETEAEGTLIEKRAKEQKGLIYEEATQKLRVEQFVQGEAASRLASELNTKMDMLNKELSADEKKYFAQSVNPYFQLAQEQVNAINLAPDAEMDQDAKADAIQSVFDTLTGFVDSSASIFNYKDTWDYGMMS